MGWTEAADLIIKGMEPRHDIEQQHPLRDRKSVV